VCLQACFDETSEGVEYIYKEPKVTSLAELSDRLTQQMACKFGAGAVRICSDTERPEAEAGGAVGGWVLVTHVTPCWPPEELPAKLTLFERTHHNVRHFMYDTPFTRAGPAHGHTADQWKRRTTLTSKLCPKTPTPMLNLGDCCSVQLISIPGATTPSGGEAGCRTKSPSGGAA
jgi:dedicator of cytokinesis protein 9/10/11